LSDDPVLRIEGLAKSFGDATVLDGISFSVARNDVLGIIGPSGAGKSTLLRCINLLEVPTAGAVYLDGERVGFREASPGRFVRSTGQDLARQRQQMTMVFQGFSLWPHKTALENTIEGLVTVKKLPRAEATERGMALLKRVGLAEKAGQYPSRLSGGQQQRVGIARALAMDPKIVLFDEPTSALDPELVADVLRVMADLAAEGTTMIVVTHEMGFAREACNRVMVMEGGHIIDQGPPAHIFGTGGNPRTQAFLARYHQQFAQKFAGSD